MPAAHHGRSERNSPLTSPLPWALRAWALRPSALRPWGPRPWALRPWGLRRAGRLPASPLPSSRAWSPRPGPAGSAFGAGFVAAGGGVVVVSAGGVLSPSPQPISSAEPRVMPVSSVHSLGCRFTVRLLVLETRQAEGPRWCAGPNPWSGHAFQSLELVAQEASPAFGWSMALLTTHDCAPNAKPKNRKSAGAPPPGPCTHATSGNAICVTPSCRNRYAVVKTGLRPPARGILPKPSRFSPSRE